MTQPVHVVPRVPPAREGGRLRERLADSISGEVRFDPASRAAYSTDASNYRQPPIGVVVPRSVDDVIATVAICREEGLPVLPRGGGTSLAGQSCNHAVVIDVSKYLREVNWVDPDRRLASVQPGCVLDDLRAATIPHGLTFGPDPATHDRCTLGGMIGNNACGMHAQVAGRTSENIEELDILLYDGTRMRVGRTPEDELERIIAGGGRRGEIYASLRDLRDRYAEQIRTRFPDIPRRVSGFALEKLLPENGFQVAQALVGTEGTCVTILEAVGNLIPQPPHLSLAVLGFGNIAEAGAAVNEVLPHDPRALEGIDSILIENMQALGMHEEELPLLPDGQAWLLVQFGGETEEEAAERAMGLLEALDPDQVAGKKLFTDLEEENRLWEIRESGLGATARVPGSPDAWPGWEDSAVPPERLGEYLNDLRELFDEYDYTGSLYGHFGQGCVHTRIDFDFSTRASTEKFRRFIEDAAELVVTYGGSLSGEHGDGQARGELLERMYGPELVEAFREFKAIWDPDDRMNPGKVVDAYPLDSNLRLGPDYQRAQPSTFFAYPRDQGSLSRSTVRCVGVGKCRRTHDGVMCPSYMVTLEEIHSTRGRARILDEMLRGEVITDGWRSDEVKKALDLCLACKGCKSDCPVDVDMATYKAEFNAHHYRRRLRPLPAYSMGLIPLWARLAVRVPRLANLLTRPPLDRLTKRLGGLAPERDLPRFTGETVTRWFAGRGTPPADREVILWPDTFTNTLSPERGKAAVEVLEAAGFRVRMPSEWLCCGRPLYDYGMLTTAKSLLRRIISSLREDIRAGTPIVCLEPSCTSVFRDELGELFPHDNDAHRLGEQTFTLAEFLQEHAPGWEMPRLERRALVQPHCHHHAIMQFHDDSAVMERIGLDVDIPDAGCCGLAGSFGYERGEKFEVSMAVGERVLLPRVREADSETIVMADGFSCSQQIEAGTGRRPLHLAEVIALAMDRVDEEEPMSKRDEQTKRPREHVAGQEKRAEEPEEPENEVVEASQESFPASDPPAWTEGTTEPVEPEVPAKKKAPAREQEAREEED